MKIEGKTVGVIQVQSNRLDAYTEDDIALLSALANVAAVAIQNTRLYEEARLRADELAVLNRLAQALTARLDVDEVLNEAYLGVSKLVDTTNFYIGLYDPEKDEISFQFEISESGQDAHITVLPADQGLSGYVVRNCTSILIREDPAKQLADMGVEAVGEPFLSWLGVPLSIGERVLGVMAVQSYTASHVYDEHDLELLTAVASQTAVALENARLDHELLKYAQELEQRVKERTVQLQAQFARQEAILRSASDGIVFVDGDGSILQANPVVQRWLQQSQCWS
jgi:GAF domain-containing protein